MNCNVVAFDFGASSGRAMLAAFDGEKIKLDEIHRFENTPVFINGVLYWDILRLFHEIKQGIIKASDVINFDSIGIDTWGVDYGLISPEEHLFENPVHYRDCRTNGMADKLRELISDEELYQKTGNQLMEINTIFQLYSQLTTKKHALLNAQKMLLIPDLFNYLLTGEKFAEETIASTTQLFDQNKRIWAYDVIDKLGLDKTLFPDIIKVGSIVGEISDEICSELAIDKKPVIAVASHDTASAVVAVPTKKEDFIFISCGTWSLFGTELKTPIINDTSKELNIANEAGYGSTTTFLKNIIGLWLIQETRRQFIRDGKNYSYGEMEHLAKECTEFNCFIDTNHAMFVPKGDMPSRIKEFCKMTGQHIPSSDGEVIRCIYESIAMEYKNSLIQIEKCTNKHYTDIHMLGGGTKDGFLCQLTANATGACVIAGPIEATALGNAAVQLIALKKIRDIKQAREIIANSFSPISYESKDSEKWNDKFEQYKKVIDLKFNQ